MNRREFIKKESLDTILLASAPSVLKAEESFEDRLVWKFPFIHALIIMGKKK